MFDRNATTSSGSVRSLLLVSSRTLFGLFDRHFDEHSIKGKTEKTKILQKRAALWQGIGSCICNAFIMHSAWMRLAEKLDFELFINQKDIFHRVAFFLAEILAFLFILVFRALDPSLCSIMTKRG